MGLCLNIFNIPLIPLGIIHFFRSLCIFLLDRGITIKKIQHLVSEPAQRTGKTIGSLEGTEYSKLPT